MAGSVGPLVVGTDFSETAALALLEARRLGVLLGAPVAVVHVQAEPEATAWTGVSESWLAEAGVDAGSVVLRQGNPWVELVRYAEEVSATLLVVGSHGRSGYHPLSAGSTAARATVQAQCPVVVVSPRAAGWTRRLQERRSTAVRVEAAAGARPGPGRQ